MADTGGTPGLPGGGNVPRLPGSGGGGKNPLEKKELDVLDPEAKPEEQGKRGLGDIAKGIKKTADKIKKIINFLKNIPPQVLLIIAIVVIIIFVIVGVIGFILFIPGLAINALKEFAQGAIDTVQSWFTTEADAYINEEDVVDLANYLEELEYDLVGYGFITPNPNFSQDLGIVTYTELQDQGYIYFERRGDDENARYYSQSAEEDPDGNSAYDGLYYNSLGVVIDNGTGKMPDVDSYMDQYGLERSTEETSNSGAGKIIGFGNDWLSSMAGWSVDTKLLRTYLLSDYKIYAIRNSDSTFLNKLYTRIKKTFGGYDAAWSKGLMKFYYAKEGLATEVWESDWDSLIYGDKIKINGTKMTLKNGYFNNPITFDIEGWADRYGMSLEFLLSLHIATMQPDLVYAMLQSFDTEVQVYLDDSGKAKVDAVYIDMLDETKSISNEEDHITIDKAEQTLTEGGFDAASFAINDKALLQWINGLAITRKNAMWLLVHLPLKSPDNCTGQAQSEIMLIGSRTDLSTYTSGSTRLLMGYGLYPEPITENVAEIWDFLSDYESFEYVDINGSTHTLESNMFTAGPGGNYDQVAVVLGTSDNAVKDDNYSYFIDYCGADLSQYGYVESEVETVEPEINELKTADQNMDTHQEEYDEDGNFIGYSYYTHRIKEVITTRTWSAPAKDNDGNDIIDENTGETEQVDYTIYTYKYLIYDGGEDILLNEDGGSQWQGNDNDDKEIDELNWQDTLICEFIIRDKTNYELEQSGLLAYNEETGEYEVAADVEDTRCSEKYTPENYVKGAKCCKNCKNYVKDVIEALGVVSDQDYASYTPYIARVLGSWFRDTYFVIPEESDQAINDYIAEVNRSPAEKEMINNSYGENGTFVKVDEDYLADTGEYWTAYEMKKDESGNPTEEYQLFYLYPNGITSDVKMEDFIADPYTVLEDYQEGYAARYNITAGMKYDSQEEAEEAGHAFVKKANTATLAELSDSELENVLWSAYSFNSDGASTGWTRITSDDGNDEVNDVYDTIGDEYPNEEGGFYYNLSSTNEVTQVEDAQRSETNPTVKWLFKYRKYYTYDGSEETAMRIAKDREAVLNWVKDYLAREYGGGSYIARNLLGKFGRSSLRQAYNNATITGLDDVAEQWLDWQLDMYYSGIIECPEDDYKLESLAFIATLDENGDTTSITETTDFNYVPQDGEELRIGDPRNPDLIRTTNITKTSLEAFTILENTKTLASEYAYRDFKELIVELDYFDKEDLSDAIEEVFTWVLPDLSPMGWPVRPWDKQDTDYGALIESGGTYDYLEETSYEPSDDEDTDDTETDGTDNSDDSEENSGENMSVVSAAKEIATLVEGWSYGSNHDDLSLENRSTHETDCSGYVTAVLIKAGYFDETKMGSREPSATEYWNHGTENVYSNQSGWSYVSQKLGEMEIVADTSGGNGYVKEDELEPGDIVAVAFDESDYSAGGHVAIYMGDGKIYEVTGGANGFRERNYSDSEWTRAFRVKTTESTTTKSFEGYEGGEYVSSPVTGKIIEYGTHDRENIYTGKIETVGYVVIEAINGEKCFTEENVANNSADTDGIDNKAAAEGLNLFYQEYEDTCAGFTITIDGFKVDLNTTDDEGNNGKYEQNEVMALYNSEEQEEREADEQAKDDAPFFVNYGESADLGSLPAEYYCDLSNSSKGYYIKEGKYLGITYTDEEATALATTSSEETDYTGPANYIRIMVKDREYSIIDNVEDYFDIPDPEDSGSSTTGIYADLEAITADSSVEEKVRAMISYYVSQGFTPEGAAGIVGNAAIENSGLVCTSGLDGSGTYVGLFQLDRNSRWQVMKSWMIANGYNEDSFAGQVRASYESEDANHLTSMGGSWEELKNLTNTEQSAELFAVFYEGCVGNLGNAGPTEWYSIGSSYPVGTYYQGLLDRKQAAANALKIYQGEAVDLYEGTSY